MSHLILPTDAPKYYVPVWENSIAPPVARDASGWRKPSRNHLNVNTDSSQTQLKTQEVLITMLHYYPQDLCQVPVEIRNRQQQLINSSHLPLPIHRLVEEQRRFQALLQNPESTRFLKGNIPASVVQSDVLFATEVFSTSIQLEDGYCGNTFGKQASWLGRSD